MKTRNKWILLIVFGLAIVIIAGFVFWPNGYVARWARRQFLVHTKKEVNDAHRHAHLRRVILLCDTDHQTLLKAGREILSQVSKDSLNPRHDEIRHLGDLKFILPKEVQIPHTIQELKPYICLISYDGYLTLEMHGGWDHIQREMSHFGVHIYPEDYKAPIHNFEYGDREILPGLWYYDEGYIHNPEYDKKIDALIEKYKENK